MQQQQYEKGSSIPDNIDLLLLACGPWMASEDDDGYSITSTTLL